MFPRPDPGAVIETRVLDPDTGEQLLEGGERGELLIGGATVFDGYYCGDNQAYDNADVFDPHTGIPRMSAIPVAVERHG